MHAGPPLSNTTFEAVRRLPGRTGNTRQKNPSRGRRQSAVATSGRRRVVPQTPPSLSTERGNVRPPLNQTAPGVRSHRRPTPRKRSAVGGHPPPAPRRGSAPAPRSDPTVRQSPSLSHAPGFSLGCPPTPRPPPGGSSPFGGAQDVPLHPVLPPTPSRGPPRRAVATSDIRLSRLPTAVHFHREARSSSARSPHPQEKKACGGTPPTGPPAGSAPAPPLGYHGSTSSSLSHAPGFQPGVLSPTLLPAPCSRSVSPVPCPLFPAPKGGGAPVWGPSFGAVPVRVRECGVGRGC
jgi:hypothetical protein